MRHSGVLGKLRRLDKLRRNGFWATIVYSALNGILPFALSLCLSCQKVSQSPSMTPLPASKNQDSASPLPSAVTSNANRNPLVEAHLVAASGGREATNAQAFRVVVEPASENYLKYIENCFQDHPEIRKELNMQERPASTSTVIDSATPSLTQADMEAIAALLKASSGSEPNTSLDIPWILHGLPLFRIVDVPTLAGSRVTEVSFIHLKPAGQWRLFGEWDLREPAGWRPDRPRVMH
jgi:hypothetical protein